MDVAVTEKDAVVRNVNAIAVVKRESAAVKAVEDTEEED